MGKRGITLIELVTVMVIIAIGAVLVVPNIGVWMPRYRLRSATRDIVSTMRTAQMRAVSSNVEYGVCFDTGELSYTLYRRNTGGGWDKDGEAQLLPKGIEFNGVTLPDDAKLNKPFAQFNPNSTSSSGNILLKNPKGAQRRIVLLATTGRVRIEE